mgnify:CR=1 FL=1|tara:strand:- start:528 stop:1160 length:633 start_codon:yes stop_codon:yes gene_type:complete
MTLLPNHNPYDLINIIPNVIPDKDIEELLLLTTTQDTRNASVIKNNEDGTHEQEEKLDVRNTLNFDLPPHIDKKLEAAVAGLFTRTIVPKYNCKFKHYDAVQMLGYPPGGHYLAHNDAEHFNTKTREWETSIERDVSFVFYLNQEFGGGELEFPELGLTIKPKRGMMVVFPSYKEFLHRVHPVTWGHRYSLVCWIGTEEKLYDTIPIAGV